MVPKVVPPPIDGAIARLAARQHGVVSRAQLVELGLSGRAVTKRVEACRLHRVHRGVYSVGHPGLTRDGRFMAAVLACGKGALLSHFSAAVLWELLKRRAVRIDLVVPRGGGRSRRGAMVVHRTQLEPGDATTRDGIPVTSPSRTLIDLADAGDRRMLERAIDEAAYLGLDLTGLRPRRGRRGSGLLQSVLAEHKPGSTLTRSDLEERFLALCRERGLPRPAVNSRIEGYEVDFAWASRRLVVETDGHRAHGSRGAFERDRRRDAELTAAGWRVVRITYRRLASEPGAVARQIRGLLDQPETV